jgi:Flp pilus assembly protein CpaB
VAVAVLLIVGFALAGAVLYSRAGSKTPVVVAAHGVAAGQTISRADLSTVAIAGPVRAIAAADLGSVVGKTAAVGLVAGQLLNRAMLSDGPAVGPGQAMVGLSLKPGQLPGDGLSAGDPVEVVQLPGRDTAAGGGSPAATVLVDVARVFALRPDESAGGQMIVTLLVDRKVAPAIAAAGSAGQVGLIKVAP